MSGPNPKVVDALSRVLYALHVGRERAATWDSLGAELYHYEDLRERQVSPRRLQEAAEVLRSRGVPVVGLSGSGVFLARSVDELDAAIREKRKRAVMALADLRTLKRQRAAMLGQTTLSEGTR